MKYLEVHQIAVAREDLYQAAAYPSEGVWLTQYDRDPVAVVAGRVWRLPAGVHKEIREVESEKEIPLEPNEPQREKPFIPQRSALDATALRRWAWEAAEKVVKGERVTDYTAVAEEILKWVLQLS